MEADLRYLRKQLEFAEAANRLRKPYQVADALRRASDALERLEESPSQPQAVLTIWGDMEGL